MISRTLFRPFEHYRETTLLVIGLLGLILGSLAGYFFQTRFDGIIDAHISPSITLLQPFADNLVNVTSLFLPLFALGYWANKKTRAVDILVAVLLSRIPIYVLALFNIGGAMGSATARVMEAVQSGVFELPWQDTTLLLVAGILGLAAIVYSIVLLYQGFRIASHVKKPIHKIGFALAVLLAEVISKVIIVQLAY